MKPLIGLTPLFDTERNTLYMRPTYPALIRCCGGVPVVLPFTSDAQEISRLLDALDGVIFCGGTDIDPALYGEARIPQCDEPAPNRDALERILFRQAYKRDMPIFGICRGFQLINVMLGGSLYQDLRSQRPVSGEHRMKDHFEDVSHWVAVVEGTPLHQILGIKSRPVNSIHHQGVRHMGKGLLPMAFASDGLLESVYDPTRRLLWGFQWHPEFAYTRDPRQTEIMRAFVSECEK